jgi:predicted Rossmann fold flavoprotein
MKTIIIGAGPAGLMAGIRSASKNNQVIILEKNEKAGKKLFITGKGRCNVTNNCSESDFIKHVVSNPKFLYSAINNFSSKDTIEFFETRNTPLVTERGNRVFPKSYKSYDITDCLMKECHKLHVAFEFNTNVTHIRKNKENMFVVETNRGNYEADNLVIATGGLSYPKTGSTGDGYQFAKAFNHTIVDTVPALTGIKIKEQIPTKMKGFTLKNVSLHLKDNKFKHSEFGELTFYENYLDGPIVITTSSLINRRDNKNLQIEIDLKPALEENTLQERLNRDIEKNPHGKIEDLLRGLLPSPFVPFFEEHVSLNYKKECSIFNKEERSKLITNLKHFPLTFMGLNGYERAVVTAGGISTKEISPKTMESKLMPGLYFAGEVIDVDAFTGGFNIQIALSTGALAGDDIKRKGEEYEY